MMAEVIVGNRYGLRDAGAFDRTVAALVSRGKAEGHPGLRAYRF
jgi:hypothetical protein